MTPFRPIIERVAGLHTLDPNLVEAIVLQESGANPWAWKPEPRYRFLWNVRTLTPFRAMTYAELASEDPPPDFPMLAGDRHQEFWAQQASWGLMQPMGANAREHGFSAPFLPQLCDPETNLLIGCSILAQLVAWAGADLRRAVAAYNAGRGGALSPAGQAYADQVLARLKGIA